MKEETNVTLIARDNAEAAIFYEKHGIVKSVNYKFFSGKFLKQ